MTHCAIDAGLSACAHVIEGEWIDTGLHRLSTGQWSAAA